MPIEEQRFIDINGAEHLLSEKMDEIKDWIVQQEQDGLTTVTDFTEGGMNYFLLCYAASMGFDLEGYADELIRHGFINTATGEFLERLAARNGIFREPGDYATTNLILTIPDPLTFDAVIEAGTEFGTDESIIFTLTEDTTILAGELTVTGKVQCNEDGIIGNVNANTIINIFTELNLELTCTNTEDVVDGKDSEPDESLRERASTPNVGTDLWIESVAKTLTTDAFCYNIENNMKLLIFKPSSGVVKADIEALFNEKQYCTRNIITVQEATPHPVITIANSIVLIIKEGFINDTVINIVKSRITSYVNNLRIGDVFKPICIKYICESTDGVLHAELTGYTEIDLTNEQYATITGELNVTKEE